MQNFRMGECELVIGSPGAGQDGVTSFERGLEVVESHDFAKVRVEGLASDCQRGGTESLRFLTLHLPTGRC